MPINPQIAMGVQPMQLQLPDPNAGMNALARAMQIKGSMAEGDLNALKIQEARRGITEANALNEAYKGAFGPDGALDRNKLMSALATGGLGSKIPGVQKSFLDVDKATADLGKTKVEKEKIDLDMSLKRAEHVASVLSLAKDPQSYEMVRRTLAATFPQAAAGLPEQFDPGFVQAQVAQGMTIVQKLTDQRAREQQAETARHNRSSEGIQIRGQNMVDARTREGNEIQRSAARTQIVETPEGVMLVDKGTGQARPATAGGSPLAGKPSAAMEKELTGIRQQRSIVRGALDAVKANPDAFSMGRGLATMAGPIPESVAGRFDTDAQRQARSYLFNNVSKVINERAGAAQSAQELARLRSFLPAETDAAPQIISKMEAFDKYLDDMEAGTRGKPAPRTGGATGGWSIQKVN